MRRLGAETEPASAIRRLSFLFQSASIFHCSRVYGQRDIKCRKRNKKTNLRKTQLLGVDVVDCQGCGVIQERQSCVKYEITNHVIIAIRRNLSRRLEVGGS